MAFRPIAGATFDLYREQIFNNPSTYAISGTQTLTDHYRTNVQPQDPAHPNRTANPAYVPQPLQPDWHTRTKGDINKGSWTTTFPTIPGT